MKIEYNNYLNIQGWMRTELNLRGNDLLVYAIIYGFSQDSNSKFIGSLQYLADWCGATKQGILKNLNNLINMGLILKEDSYINGIKYTQYSCIALNKVSYSVKQSLTNNINKNYNSNTKVLEYKYINTNTKVLVEKNRKQNKFEQCVNLINEFTTNIELSNLLVQYLKMRLEIKDKPMYINQWKGLLNKLNKLSSSIEEQKDIVQQSLDRGYASFYKINTNKKFNNTSWNANVTSQSYTDDELEKLDEQEKELNARGIRTRF